MLRELVDVTGRALLLGALSLLLLALGGALACAPLLTDQGPTVQLDPDVDDQLGGTGVESGDVRGASEQIARALAGMRHQHAHPRIAVAPVQNLSRFRIDGGLLKNRLTHELVQRARGRFELIPLDDDTPSTAADYLLKTELRSLTKDNGAATSDYLQYAFMLERPTDGAVLWSGMFETKRKSSVDVIYQ